MHRHTWVYKQMHIQYQYICVFKSCIMSKQGIESAKPGFGLWGEFLCKNLKEIVLLWNTPKKVAQGLPSSMKLILTIWTLKMRFLQKNFLQYPKPAIGVIIFGIFGKVDTIFLISIGPVKSMLLCFENEVRGYWSPVQAFTRPSDPISAETTLI